MRYKKNQSNEVEQFDQTDNEVLGNVPGSEEFIVEETQPAEKTEISNGLENFEIEEETPELFNLG